MGQLLLQVIVMVKVFSSEEDDADLTLFLLCSPLLYLGPSSRQNVRDYDSLSKDCVQRLAVSPRSNYTCSSVAHLQDHRYKGE